MLAPQHSSWGGQLVRGTNAHARLAVFVSHPVQYHVPLWRRLSSQPGVDVKLFYFSDQNLHGSIDPGFGVPVTWDVPLLQGYDYEFLRRGDLSRRRRMGVRDPVALLRSEQVTDVLLVGYAHPFERQILMAARKVGARVLMRGEFSDLGEEERSPVKVVARELYLRWFYSNVDAFGYIGHDALQHLRSRGVPESKLFSSPYCIDNELFEVQRAKFARAEARAKLGLTDDQFALIFTGKLIPRKDPLFLLDAIAQSQVAEKIALIVLGDGELREPFLAKGRQLLGSRLLFQGFVNQSSLGQHYSAADAFVLPSRVETWGMVANEAMLFGLPVVLSDQVGCSRDLVIPYRTGFSYRGGNTSELAAHIRWLVEHRSEARRMGLEAREHVASYNAEAATRGVLAGMGLT